MQQRKARLFNGMDVRCVWVEAENEWYYSIADALGAITGLRDTKQLVDRVKNTSGYLSRNWSFISVPRVLPDKEGVKRRIMTTSTKNLFRIIMEMENVRAESYKLWICAMASDHLNFIDL